jgi:2-polyprenyl-3-methyl-5-hydroxy-6-metoxy-1,4-benzoquinol methylase
MFESFIHRVSSHLLKNHVNKCLDLPGGRSRPDKSFPFIKFVLDRIGLEGKIILDLGCGRGSYGYLLKKIYGQSFRIIGVDVYSDYFHSPSYVGKYYDQYFLKDIRNLNYTSILFDIALACDVIEHISQDDAIRLINKLHSLEKLIILSIPIAPKHWIQASTFEDANPAEKHVNNWTLNQVEKLLSLKLVGQYDAIGVFSNIESMIL